MVCWVEVQDKVGWWPAQVISVPPRVPEGQLRVRLFGNGEEKEIEADSESMSFEEPGVGQNLQKAPASDFISKAAYAQFKSAVAEAQKCSKEGGLAESEDDGVEAEEVAEAPPQGRTTRKRKEAAPTTSVEGLPDGWVCSTHVTPSGQQYKRYKGPGGGRAQSLKQVWVLHDKAVAKGSVASSARASEEQEAAAAKGGEGMPRLGLLDARRAKRAAVQAVQGPQRRARPVAQASLGAARRRPDVVRRVRRDLAPAGRVRRWAASCALRGGAAARCGAGGGDGCTGATEPHAGDQDTARPPSRLEAHLPRAQRRGVYDDRAAGLGSGLQGALQGRRHGD